MAILRNHDLPITTLCDTFRAAPVCAEVAVRVDRAFIAVGDVDEPGGSET
jgi:hypothetical protein